MFWPRADRDSMGRGFRPALLVALTLAAGAALGVGTPSVAGAAENDTPPLKAATAIDDGGAGASIRLFWPAVKRAGAGGMAAEAALPVGVSAAVVGREIRLGFDRPLGNARLDGLPQALPGWVDNVLYGYDSVLVVMAAGVEGAVDAKATGVVVRLVRPIAASPAVAEGDTEKADTQRLDFLQALVMMEQGQVKPARSKLDELVQRDPRDAQSVQLLANAEERLGHWRDALRLTRQALHLTPNEPELQRAERQLRREHADFARLDVDLFAVHNGDTQRVARLTGRSDAGPDGSFDYWLEGRTIAADQVNGKDGVQRAFRGRRQVGRLSYTHEWPDDDATRVSLFAATDVAGAGVQHEWRGDGGVLRFGGHWREPTTSTLEGVVHAGWRHRVFGEFEERLSPRWLVTAGAGWNLYGLGTEPPAAHTATVTGALTYTVLMADPTLTVGYTLDAEYVARNRRVDDPFGNPVHPLSLATREVHAGQVGIDWPLTDELRANLVSGYAWDRKTHGAPFGAVALAYEPVFDLELGVRASHIRSTARGTADRVNSAGAYLLWRY